MLTNLKTKKKVVADTCNQTPLLIEKKKSQVSTEKSDENSRNIRNKTNIKRWSSLHIRK